MGNAVQVKGVNWDYLRVYKFGVIEVKVSEVLTRSSVNLICHSHLVPKCLLSIIQCCGEKIQRSIPASQKCRNSKGTGEVVVQILSLDGKEKKKTPLLLFSSYPNRQLQNLGCCTEKPGPGNPSW